MAEGRTVQKFTRVYAGGYDMSGYGRTIGPLLWEYGEADLTAQMGDQCVGRLPTTPNISPSMLNVVFDNTATSGSHVRGNAGNGSAVNLSAALGIRAEPAMGDPVFMGRFQQTGYQETEESGGIFANMTLSAWDAGSLPTYAKPWGRLVHAKAARTAANSANTNINNGAATAKGGWLIYHVFAAAGSLTMLATISIDDSANGTDWLALSGATSGEIACSAPTSGIVYLATTATVRQYLRWQLALNTATSVTFALAFVRA